MPTTFTNQATLSYNNQSIPSNVVTGVLTEVLSVSKTAIPAAYQNGDTITYAVQLVNSGTAALTGLTLTDNLGAYTPAAGCSCRSADVSERYAALLPQRHPAGDADRRGNQSADGDRTVDSRRRKHHADVRRQDEPVHALRR